MNGMKEEYIGQAVRVLINKKVVVGRVTGRQLPFASIVIPGQVAEIVFSWSAVGRAINENTILKV
jgi:hypothetical protein